MDEDATAEAIGETARHHLVRRVGDLDDLDGVSDEELGRAIYGACADTVREYRGDLERLGFRVVETPLGPYVPGIAEWLGEGLD